MRLVLAALAVALLAPLAAGHGADDEPTIGGRDDLLVGAFEGAQPGPLVVVPLLDGDLGCAAPGQGAVLPLGDGAVELALNATHLGAFFDVGAPAYAALLVSTRDGWHSLIDMQDTAIALHDVVAALVDDVGALAVREGEAGVPYPTGAGHAGSAPPLAEPAIQMLYLGDAPWAGCAGGEAGHIALLVRRDEVGEALDPGNVVHVVLLTDVENVLWLSRPLEGSTAVAHANLYLTRPGEDPHDVRSALSGSIGLGEAIPVGLLVLGLAWTTRLRPGG